MSPFTSAQLAAFRVRLADRGETVQEFCQTQGISYHVVMGLLHQRCAGTRGEGHRAAVLMGLKRAPRKQRKAVAQAPGDTAPAFERRVAERRSGADRRAVRVGA